MSFTTSALVLTWLALALLALALAGVVRQLMVVTRRLIPVHPGGPMRNVPAPPLEGVDGMFRDGNSVVLLFVDESCPTCVIAVSELDRVATDTEAELSFVSVYPGRSSGNGASAGQTIENQSLAFARFQIPVTPYAVFVKDGLIVAAQPVGGEGLLTEFVRSQEEAYGTFAR